MFNQHRTKLIKLLEKTGEIVYIRGAPVSNRYGTDFEYPFRQESNFFYLSGVWEPDFAMLFDPAREKFMLFSPRRDALYALWHGFVFTQDEIKEKYGADEIYHTDELAAVLKRIKPEKVYCLNDDQAEDVRKAGLKTDSQNLTDMLAHCRVNKTAAEIKCLREAARVANLAHEEVRKALRPGMWEYELKAIFEYHCVRNGCLHPPYNGIHAGGVGSAVLHYVQNDRKINAGDLYLIDAGAEYNGYAADITRTWAADGAYSPVQQELYDVVLEMQKTAIANSGPGVAMEDLQLKACRILVERMIDLGYLKGSADELMEQNIFALFFPHGLGHFLGLNTHDPGGYPKGVDRIDRPGLKYLRARRVLEPGMVVTIEPGFYIIPALLNPAFEDPLQSRYLNVDRLKKMMDFGGIRIEDNLVITETGFENLTDVRT